jgi:small subunit ribosomal protein S7
VEKKLSQKIVYGALDIVKTNNQSEDPLDYFQKSINNVKPSVRSKSRRVGGATYQVPMEVRSLLELRLLLLNGFNKF